METDSGNRPPRAEAAQTLRQLADDESAVRYPQLPRWFFPVMAGLVAGLALVQLLDRVAAHRLTLALGVVTLLLASRYWMNRDGVAWAAARFTDSLPFLLGVLGTFAVGWVVAATSGASWVWVVAAVVAGGIVLRTGYTYRQAHGG